MGTVTYVWSLAVGNNTKTHFFALCYIYADIIHDDNADDKLTSGDT